MTLIIPFLASGLTLTVIYLLFECLCEGLCKGRRSQKNITTLFKIIVATTTGGQRLKLCKSAFFVEPTLMQRASKITGTDVTDRSFDDILVFGFNPSTALDTIDFYRSCKNRVKNP